MMIDFSKLLPKMLFGDELRRALEVLPDYDDSVRELDVGTMCQNMRHGNLLQISQRKIIEITSVNSPKAVVKALGELISCGAIAIRIEGTTHRAPVYMINPAIATVGTEIDKLGFIFWQYADKSDTAGEEYQNPKDKWNALTKFRTYSKGYDGQEEGARTVFFNKINEPNLKKNKKKKPIEMKDNCKQEDASATA